MSETLQIISFGVSFLFGFCFHILTNIHFNVIKNCSLLLKYISSIIFMLDIVLLYILIMYHLNNGIIHIYFLFLVGIGFVCYHVLHKRVKFFGKLLSYLEKKIHR